MSPSSPRHRKANSSSEETEVKDREVNVNPKLGEKRKSKSGLGAVVNDLRAGLRELPTSMRCVMAVMALTWVSVK